MQHLTGETILLIEADASLRRLITLGLQQRGMHVIGISSPEALPMLETLSPGLVVLDIDGEAGSDHSLLTVIRETPALCDTPAIVLAWDCLLPETIPQDRSQAQLTCLTKPFDARTLHTTIERILAANKAGTVAREQGVLLAARSATPAPSIWPLVTATGLLLLIIGLMVQIAIAALGLLVVLVALLLWTLGSKPEQKPIALEVREAWRGQAPPLHIS
ncbi:MAG TPA: hypothetical protein VFA09_18180 [Ktedonobacteraceae bacterium]|nr:hypothetical protein [Ktedonobacteraceae bacterium]